MHKKTSLYELIIVGGGPAGIAAVVFAKETLSNVLLIERKTIGGRVNEIPLVTNYIGIPHIEGTELGSTMKAQVLETGVIVEQLDVDFVRKENGFFVVGNQETFFRSRAVIVATGSSWKELKLKKTSGVHFKNISYRVNSDSNLAKGKNIIVVGGGYSGSYAAIFLANFAKKIYLIHGSQELNVDSKLKKQIEMDNRIEVCLNSIPLETRGKKKLESCVVLESNKLYREIEVEMIFPCIGNTPNSELIKEVVDCTANGSIETRNNFETSIEGLFAAGDVNSRSKWQIATAVADGVQAAQAAAKYLLEKKNLLSNEKE